MACDADHRFIVGYDAPGIAWTPHNRDLAVTGGAADTYNQVLRDPPTGDWRVFTRTASHPSGSRVKELTAI